MATIVLTPKIYRYSLLAVLCAVSACSSMYDKPADTTAAARATASQSAEDAWHASNANEANVVSDWLRAFNSNQLNRLVAESQANNNNLQAAAAQVERANALAKSAGAVLSPSLNLTASGGRSGIIDEGSSGSLSVATQASWQIDVWGRLKAGQSAAVASAEAAQADYEYAQYSLAASVASSYFLAIEAVKQEQVAQGVVDSLAKIGTIVKVQYDNGVASAQDVALSNTDLATAKSRLASTQASKRDALRAVELLLGRYPAAEVTIESELPELPVTPPAGLPSQLLERRPDLIAAERRIAATVNGVNQAKAARLPSINLTASVGGASAQLSSLLDPVNVAWQAASSLLVPVLDGGRLKAEIALANADQKAAVAAYAQAAQTAFSEVESALDQSWSLNQRYINLVEAQKESEEALRIAELRYKEGESALLDVLSIQQRVFSARSSLLSVERGRLQSFINLNLALGGSW